MSLPPCMKNKVALVNGVKEIHFTLQDLSLMSIKQLLKCFQLCDIGTNILYSIHSIQYNLVHFEKKKKTS